MSSITDIQYAMYGEQLPKPKPEAEYIPKTEKIKNITPNTQNYVVFKLVNSNRKGGVYLPCTDHVIDTRTVNKDKPNGDGPELIRVLNGVHTIWAKEQEKLTPDFIKKNLRTISFAKGSRFLSVPAWDKPLLEFMRACRHNIQNPNRTGGSKFEFFEYNPEDAAKFRMQRELKEIEAIQKASDMAAIEMEKHCLFLGVKIVDELGMKKGEQSLRLSYILEAKRDPERFLLTASKKTVGIQYKVRKAISGGFIDTGREKGKVFWGKGGGLISSIPSTETPLNFLTALAETPNEEGKQFLEKLNSLET